MTHDRTSFLLLAVALGACDAGAPADAADADQAHLQALLHDDALGSVPRATPQRAAPARPAATVFDPDDNLAAAFSFDDCGEFDTALSSFDFAREAFRSIHTACVEHPDGGLAVAITGENDLVYLPDSTSFGLDQGVTAGGLFQPLARSGNQTLLRKRDADSSSFALMLVGGRYQFVINLGDGRAASVTAPAKAKLDTYQSVVGTYDGTTLALYVDGALATRLAVTGAIPTGDGPLILGNDGSHRWFHGAIDDVVFATHALAADQITQLTCASVPPTVVVPMATVSLPPGGSATVDLTFTNNNPPTSRCKPLTFRLTAFDVGLFTDPVVDVPASSAPVAAGQTGHMAFTLTAPYAPDAGQQIFQQLVIDVPAIQFSTFTAVPVEIAAQDGCRVSTARELMAKDVSVVEDARAVGHGAWSFGHLMENLAASPADAPAMVEAMFRTFATTQTVNSFALEPRLGVLDLLDAWPRTADGQLDLAQAPVQLLAIVNRFDLRDLAAGDAGEGRFVFGFTIQGPGTPFATMILEYKLPAATDADVRGWAQAFHALGALPAGDAYNAALQAVTDRFTSRGARPGAINGSAIARVRTNEFHFATDGWKMRQFELSPATHRLVPAALPLTPDLGFNNTETLAAYLTANRDAILAETHTVPASFASQPFQAGQAFNDLTSWFAPGADPEVRHHFALNTCNGCHSLDENAVRFTQIANRVPHEESLLSKFLTGGTVFDPVTGAPRRLDDLGRRKRDLAAVVCPGAPAVHGVSLRRGIHRTD